MPTHLEPMFLKLACLSVLNSQQCPSAPGGPFFSPAPPGPAHGSVTAPSRAPGALCCGPWVLPAVTCHHRYAGCNWKFVYVHRVSAWRRKSAEMKAADFVILKVLSSLITTEGTEVVEKSSHVCKMQGLRNELLEDQATS